MNNSLRQFYHSEHRLDIAVSTTLSAHFKLTAFSSSASARLYIHTASAPVSWAYDFITSCVPPRERAAVMAMSQGWNLKNETLARNSAALSPLVATTMV